MGVGTSAGLMYVGAPVILDDAQLYIAAVESTGYVMPTTEKDAVVAYVAALKANGTWTKKRAIYLFSGNTAASQKWNLKDPRDLDAAYRLTYVGGVTHAANGMKFNPPSHAETYLSGATLVMDSVHCSVWTNGGTPGDVVQIGVYDPARVFIQTSIVAPGTGTAITYGTFILKDGIQGVGQFNLNYNGSVLEMYKGGALQLSEARAPLTGSSFTFYLGALNSSNTEIASSDDLLMFSEIGKTQTPLEILADFDALALYLNAIGRISLHADTVIALKWLNSIGEYLNGVELGALDRLVRDLHGEVNGSYATSDIWAKFIGLYPMPGSTAGSHSLNLKTPGTHTLTYDAGVAHSAAGVQTAPSVLIHTGIVPQTHLQRLNKHLSAHQSATLDLGSGKLLMSTITAAGASHDNIVPVATAGGQIWSNLSDNVSAGISHSLTSKSFFSHSRTSAGTIEIRANSISAVLSKAASPDPQHASEIAFNSYDAGTGMAFIFDWGSIGTGMTPAELVNLEDAWRGYQGAIGRSTSVAVAVVLFVVLALLFSLGITLTQQQIEELNNILLGLPPGPAPAFVPDDAVPAKKSKKKKFTKKDIPPEALEYLRSLGHKL